MAITRMAPARLRLDPLATICLAVALLVNASGCSHRRSAMRPIYSASNIPAPRSSTTEIIEESVPQTAPPRFESGTSEPELFPINPPKDSSVRPSRNSSPPAADALDEPDLRTPADPSSERVPKANIKGPELNAPSASRATGLRASGKIRQTTLRERVRPFVNDPEDLFQPPKSDRSWKYIVVHHSANDSGSYDQIDREHRKIQGWDGCGYHFVIGNGTESADGQIEVARRWVNQKHGLHCRDGKNPDVNEYGIGICLIGDLDKSPPTPKQIAAARALVAYLAQRYDIPSDAIGTHAELAAHPTACPGQFFPVEPIFGSKHLAAK